MAKKGLSNRQQRILEFIREFGEERSYPPTVRDIQQACEVSSTSVVDYNLRILERLGLIRRDREVSRGIELLVGGRRRGRLPVLGYIAAGEPSPVPTQESWADFEAIDEVDVPPGMVGEMPADAYALRVKGTSMIDALVDDGDVVIVRPVDAVKNGDMVVAWLQTEKEVTLKRFYNEGERVRLQPANSTMEPIYVDPENLEVQGKVVAVLRSTL